MAQNVGQIYYSVESDTSNLVRGAQRADDSLDNLQRQFTRTDSSARASENQMTKTAVAVKSLGREAATSSNAIAGINRFLAGLLALRTAEGLTRMADAWTDLQNRLRLVTTGQKELNQATSDVFKIAQNTSQEIDAVATIYQRFAQNAQKLGLNLQDVAEVTSTVSKAVAVSGASASSAQAALVQFGQALASGTLRGEELNSIMEQTPALASAIAKGLGITTGELRKMGGEGQITGAKLVQALQKASDSVDEQFATRIKTVRQSFVELGNALTKFVGETSTASSASSTLAEGVMMVTNNIQALASVLLAAGAGALARYVLQAGAALATSLQAAVSARVQASQELALARAHVATATAAAASAAANAALGGSHAAAGAAANVQSTALVRLAAAEKAAQLAGVGFLSILGGPIGIIAMVASVATGFLLFRDNADSARASLLNLQGPIDETIKKFKELGEIQRAGQISRISDAYEKEADAASGAISRFVDGLPADLSKGTRAAAQFRAGMRDELRAVVGDTTKSSHELESSVSKLVDAWSEQNGWTKAATEQYRLAALEMVETQGRANATAQTLRTLTGVNDALAESAKNAAAGHRILNAVMNDGQTDDYLKSLKDRLGSLQDEGSALKAAQRYLKDLKDVSEDRRKTILDEAAAVDKLKASQDAQKKAASTAAGAAKKDGTQEKSAREENIKTLRDLMNELNQVSMSSRELAVVKAELRLNKYATPEQVAQIRSLADELYKVTEQGKNTQVIQDLGRELGEAALSARELAASKAEGQLNEFATPEDVATVRAMATALFDVNEEQKKRDEFGKDPTKTIRGEVAPLKGGVFNEQTARYEAEKKAEEERYAGQLERLQAAEALKIEVVGGYMALEEQMQQEHADRIAQIEQAKNEVMMSGAANAFGTMASDLQAFSSVFGKENKAMFAVMKASAIAQTIIQTYQAAQSSYAALAGIPIVGPALGAAAAAAAVMGGLARVAQIRSQGSGKLYGGAVNPRSMHRINENGAPEVFNAANGQQYMLPNTRGEVVSNKDAANSGTSGGSSVIINLIENPNRGGETVRSTVGNQEQVDIFVADIRGGGRRAQAMESAYGLVRRGN